LIRTGLPKDREQIDNVSEVATPDTIVAESNNSLFTRYLQIALLQAQKRF
jgi:hypothetical protein